jgi:peptidoglycan hydrolase CwlO-like protein
MERRIKELTAFTSGRDQEIKQLKTSLGRQLYDKFKKEIQSGKLADAAEPADRLNREIPDTQRLKQNILKKVEREDAIKEQSEQLKQEKKTVADQLKSFHVEIGKLAYIHYKDTSESDFSMEALFRDLSKTEDKIREIDNELYLAGSNAERGFFSNLLQKGKALFLASRRKTLTMGMAGLYRKTGEQICSTTLFEEMADTDFADLAAPYRENKAKFDRIEEEESKIRDELKDIREELKKICEGKTTRRKVAEIDKLIADKNRELDLAYMELGSRYVAEPTALSGTGYEQKDIVARIEKLEEDNARDRKEISILEAKIDIEKMFQNIGKKTSRIETLDREITQKKQEIKDLKKDITQLEQDIAKKQAFLEENGVTAKMIAPVDPGDDED